jgi:hypothetical protein
MASQPANTQISVRRTVRTRVEQGLFDSIKERTQRLGPQVVIAPGEEIDVYLILDGSGTNAPGPNPAWRFGMPVTAGNVRTRSTVGEMYTAIAADADAAPLDFPQQIVATRQDRFLLNTPDFADNDLHQDVRRNSPTPRGLFIIV